MTTDIDNGLRYQDSGSGAIQVLVDETGLRYSGTPFTIPDPGDIPGVWLVILDSEIPGKQSDWKAFLVYTNDQYFEEVDVTRAVEQYGTTEMKKRFIGNTFNLPLVEEY